MTDELDPVQIDQIARLLKRAKSVLFMTGAGISADSGLPTYRGIGGLYEDADVEEGMPIEKVLSRRLEASWSRVGKRTSCSGATTPWRCRRSASRPGSRGGATTNARGIGRPTRRR